MGRAGCIIADDIENALHVRLVAPMEYRVKKVKARLNLKKKEAIQNVLDNDKKRTLFMKFFKGDKPDDQIFDLMLNREKLSDDEIVETIYRLAEFRDLV